MKNPDKLEGNTSEMAKEAGKCYLLEADVSYPNDLHNLHNDLPFMCKKRINNGVQKLVPNLYDKKKHVIHITALDQDLKHRLVLDKVHWVINFNQSTWLALYIEFNTLLRTRAQNNFEKDFLKLMNNPVFGKTMENIRKYGDIKLVMKEKAYLKKVMKLKFKSGIICNESLMGCEMGKNKPVYLIMNKPVYLEQAILDLSKTIMYEFHHGYMKLKYGKDLWLVTWTLTPWFTT